MGTVIKYSLLVLLFVGLGWKLYREYYAPDPLSPEHSESTQRHLEVGDPESMIEEFYGTTGAARTRNGIKTYYFTDAEIEVNEGNLTAIRTLNHTRGTLQSGGQTFSIDESNNIERKK